MNPLTDDEAALLYHVMRGGSDAYSIRQLQRGHWLIGPWRGWSGFPKVYKTKKAAVEMFQRWMNLAHERFNAMRQTTPHIMLTAVGIKQL